MKGSTFYFGPHSVSCPVCNNPVVFRSSYTNINTCGNCNAVIERTEGAGTCKKLSLPINKVVNNSLIAIGTRGIYNKKNFEVTGCIRCFTKRFFSNRWTILYSDGTVGTLSETLGFYAIHEKTAADHPGKLQLVSGLQAGTDSTDIMKGSQMRIFDTAKCERVTVEGEVLLADDDGIFSIIELADEAGSRLELIEYSKGKFELCRLQYVLAAELSLTSKNSRPVEAVTLPCGECSKPVTITLPQYCEDVVCAACNRWNERKGDHLELNKKTLNKFNPDLPIGSKGKIKNIEYKVVAACRKCQPGIYNEIWTEYSLYNQETGFAFLAEYNGHWTYLKEVKLGIKYPTYQREITVGDENYVLFNEYNFKVTAAAGEFFVPLDSGAAIRAKEFISPPEMYAVENNDSKEITWYKGEHISNKEVFEGLNLLHKTMPLQSGIGPLQPMKGYTNMRLLKRMSLIALAVFLAVQVFFSFSAKNETVFEETIIIPDSLSSKGIVSRSFEIKPASSNLEFSIGAPVNNSWFDADITLVNDKTGKEYHIDKGVEYYAGYSDGEQWTEGSKDADAMLSAVPGGNYHLNIFTSSGGDGGKVGSFGISVRNDVPMFRNFFFVMLFASLFPLVQWGRMQLFEGRRWNNTPNNSSTKK